MNTDFLPRNETRENISSRQWPAAGLPGFEHLAVVVCDGAGCFHFVWLWKQCKMTQFNSLDRWYYRQKIGL
jgi:hypothetical protein